MTKQLETEIVYTSVYTSNPPTCKCGKNELPILFGKIPVYIVKDSELEDPAIKFDKLELNSYCPCKLRHDFIAYKRKNLVTLVMTTVN
jgi:hypothetical protein